MRSDITPGSRFPDYELPDHENVPRKLSEIQGDDPMILTLARGHYWPKEHQQHLELAANYPKINVAFTKVATIVTDPHHTLQEFRKLRRGAAAVPRGHRANRSEGSRHPGAHGPRERPDDPVHDRAQARARRLQGLQRLLVLGQAELRELWRDLREVSREIRPDWDLSAPGLREAWDAGDVSPFHGWNRRVSAPGSADGEVR